jgi:hypothetical protein
MADFNPSGVWEAQLIVGTQVTLTSGRCSRMGRSLDRQTGFSEPVRGVAGRLAASLYSRSIGLTKVQACTAAGLTGTVL